ncbi:MAG: rhomboid family intramembrane serine protease [Gemmatimonadales bacterium]|jgi:rhomboid protease GluP|nr:rhomboid family intramembrane serine protease [Gemmatimonadales bacterium]
MRKTTGSMVCPNCRKLIGVGEKNCPFCGAWNPGLFGYAPALQRLFGGRLDLIHIIVVACVGLYVAALVLQPEAIFKVQGFLGILSPGNRALYQLGMTGGYAWEQRWWWTLFTAIFLHGGILHIVFNVLWIRNLGPMVERTYGPARAFIIFMLSGAIGFVVSNLASGAPTLGASGSIFGLLAALIVYGRKHGGQEITGQLWQWAIIMFAMGFMMSGVNNWAHAGGFAGGWLTATAMRFEHEKRESALLQVLALALLALTAAGVVLSFVRVTSILLLR